MAIVVGMHLAAAVAAVLLGIGILLMRRGTPQHRRAGRLWVTAMAVTAVTSFGIRELDAGHFSWLHALSAYVLTGLVLAVMAIRRGNVSAHRRQMLGLYAGLVIAGGAAVAVPGRVLNSALAQMWHHGAAVASGSARGEGTPAIPRRTNSDKQAAALKQTQGAPKAGPGSLAMTGGEGA
ncbi:DUF2306 domain-containing protein [Pandoraea bronchicola]|uniref:DUF2306 domain-containing protein n=1 Tax=Pandoraea bronchicola TaxID=2508287 RepID=A0A5E5BTC4_9BURK|nr:DUF2306 domain-containing protein [Pandoraea bronchicola]VVE89561.1 hypothetical protein PBR20603_03533 [Pandoraea bronchicola]